MSQRILLTPPIRVLPWMLAFIALVAVLAALLLEPLTAAFMANPGFNGLIVGVLVIGMAINLRQVLAMQREAGWLDRFRRSDPDKPLNEQPRLLAPLARMLATRERGKFVLTAPTLRSVLDGVRLRLDESRDNARYVVGLLVFLGLLGTFWGLLATIRAVADIIGTLDVSGEAVAMFNQLKGNLRAPLDGMGTSFSTSLFGLGGSLILGFLDLQAAHAQNRFYNELEEWLSSMTRLSGGSSALEGDSSVPAYVQALLEQTADGLERMQRAMVEGERERRGLNEQLGELSNHMGKLAELLAREARNSSLLVETQAELKPILKRLAEQGSDEPAIERMTEALRSELRLLSRTLAATRTQRVEPEPSAAGPTDAPSRPWR